MNKKIRLWIIIFCIISFGSGLFFQYVGNFYQADIRFLGKYENIEVNKEIFDNYTIYGDKDSDTGIIFYPGGKIEYTAYDPLMKGLADKGFFCVLLEMPYNLAVFGIDLADGVQEMYPKVNEWYMAGHSLGGAMAGVYLSDNYKKYEGLILLASYVTNDLTYTDLNVISIYGTEDKVLNRTKYDKYLINYPSSFEEIIIHGGNHSNFGVYGLQNGDGEAKITNEQQIDQTVNIIKNYIFDRKDYIR